MSQKNEMPNADQFVKWVKEFLAQGKKACCPITDVDKVPDLTPKQVEDNEVAQEAPDLVVSNSQTPLEGLLIFYVNVGSMPPANVDAYLKRMKESYKVALDRIPDKYAVIWIPRRPNGGNDSTTVELVRL